MAYQALYRKHRPQTFEEVVGQDHVTTTLTREVVDGKVAHAYLFSGPRGTGKTTTARILAKALNCQNRSEEGQPCNECVSCVGITDASSLDVIELDAASHNKVEDVREIRVNAGTVASMGGAKRVYILDEAHMLSRAASNALLKILEEPPDHVHFVMATTEPYKLPDTIRSRAQHFDFHPISHEVLRNHVESIGAKEGYSITDDAAALIVDHAAGSARDALSLLEQVAALGEGKVEVGMVTKALGLADRQAFDRLAAAIDENDAPAALELVAMLASQGADLRHFVAEALGFFRGVFLAQYAPNVDEIVDESAETVDTWRQTARMLDSGDVLRAIDQLSDVLAQLRDGREERLVVELALLRLTRPETAFDSASLASRLDRVEEKMRRSPAATTPTATPTPLVETSAPLEMSEEAKPPVAAVADIGDAKAPEAPVEVPTVPPAEGLTLEGVETIWPALVARVRDDTGPRRHALFRETTPTAVKEPATIVLGVPAHLPFHLEQLKADLELQRVATESAVELLGGSVAFEFEATADRQQAPDIADEPPEKVPDKAHLAVAPEGGDDPTGLILEELGGSVVADD